MNFVDFLTGNLILNLSIFSWAIAQILKFIVILVSEDRMDWRAMLSSGGMPSSHASFVCACAASVAYLYGWSSPLFAVAAAMAVVVMYDASNVRRAAGDQAKVLNYIMGHWTEMRPAMFGQELKELLGHTPLQVLMGALLGVAIGWGGAWFFTR